MLIRVGYGYGSGPSPLRVNTGSGKFGSDGIGSGPCSGIRSFAGPGSTWLFIALDRVRIDIGSFWFQLKIKSCQYRILYVYKF